MWFYKTAREQLYYNNFEEVHEDGNWNVLMVSPTSLIYIYSIFCKIIILHTIQIKVDENFVRIYLLYLKISCNICIGTAWPVIIIKLEIENYFYLLKNSFYALFLPSFKIG